MNAPLVTPPVKVAFNVLVAPVKLIVAPLDRLKVPIASAEVPLPLREIVDAPDAAERFPAASLVVLAIRLSVPLLSVTGPPDRRALLFPPVLFRTIDALLML